MNEASGSVIIVGSSVRAAAWSALRAGLAPFCVDLFADRDLTAVATARAISAADYPDGLARALANAPPTPLLYTGALENRPRLIERLGRHFPLWGNGPAVLRRVRSPFLVAASLRHAGLPCPAVSRTPPGTASSRRWVVKPRLSAGGRGMRFWDHRQAQRLARSCYFQERIDGECCSAVYVGHGDGTSHLLGVTRQLVGESWLNAAAFHYCGSVGPWPLTPPMRACFDRLGGTLVRDFALRGLFGVDCALRDALPWPVEINPRYTASMEIIEWASGQPMLALHARAFGWEPASTLACAGGSPHGGMLAKAVFFASRPMVFPEEGPWCATLAQPWQPWAMPECADIPAAGQRFSPGEPVLTMFARGDNLEACVVELKRKAAEFTP